MKPKRLPSSAAPGQGLQPIGGPVGEVVRIESTSPQSGRRPIEPSLTDALCTRCALCCDGSLFADVELATRAEVLRLEILGLEVEDDAPRGGLLSLPCRGLRGTQCSVYAHRPETCRTFECRLLQDVRHGTVSLERAQTHVAQAHRRIARVKELLKQLGDRERPLPLRERCAEALARPIRGGREVEGTHDALEAAIAAVDAAFRKTFLPQLRTKL